MKRKELPLPLDDAAIEKKIRFVYPEAWKGFGGECFRAAGTINRLVFGGRGTLVGAANRFWLDRGRFFGHVAVLYKGKYWDADAWPKEWSDIDEWGMLDAADPDYAAPGFDVKAAAGVVRLTGAELQRAWRTR